MRGPNKVITERARKLRRSSTDAELRLWNRLRSRSLNNHKFVRQEPIGPFFVDFVCRERKLVIELDGGQHSGSEKDVERDRWLVKNGYRIIRFWNNEVFENIAGVLEVIAAALVTQAAPHPDR